MNKLNQTQEFKEITIGAKVIKIFSPTEAIVEFTFDVPGFPSKKARMEVKQPYILSGRIAVMLKSLDVESQTGEIETKILKEELTGETVT